MATFLSQGCSHECKLIPDWVYSPFYIPDWITRMSIQNHVNLDRDFTLEWNSSEMKSRLIIANIKIVCKMGNFIHVLKCIGPKIAKKVRWLVHESETSFNPEWYLDSPGSFHPQLNLSGDHELNLKCRLRSKLKSDSCKLPISSLVTMS